MKLVNESFKSKSAVFLDRDGVINPLVFNPDTGEYESPHEPQDFEIYSYVLPALRRLTNLGFALFLVSNQPSYAKGKTSMGNLNKIHELLDAQMRSNNVHFTNYYYCYHHPDGVVPDLTMACACRKPGAKFIIEAQERFNVDLSTSYFIGDQDTDVECGQRANLKTILILNQFSTNKRGNSSPDFVADDLLEATKLIAELEGRV